MITALTLAVATPSWEEDLLAAFDAAAPDAGWTLAPVALAPREPGPVVDILADGTAAARWPNIVLKQGATAGTSPDGRLALLVAEDVLVCVAGTCAPLPSIDPDEIDFHDEEVRRCVYPLCGGAEIAALAQADTAFLVADVVVARDGSVSYTVRDLLVGIELAVAGVEPDEL